MLAKVNERNKMEAKKINWVCLIVIDDRIPTMTFFFGRQYLTEIRLHLYDQVSFSKHFEIKSSFPNGVRNSECTCILIENIDYLSNIQKNMFLIRQNIMFYFN